MGDTSSSDYPMVFLSLKPNVPPGADIIFTEMNYKLEEVYNVAIFVLYCIIVITCIGIWINMIWQDYH